ncbi:MAG: nicotinate-nucleotide adenylyltransferase [Candidatus Thiodiazotropha sp.]
MIGILGGTFDPIHYGHLRTALDVQQALGLDEVRFIPLHQAVHRDQPETPAEIRLRMVRTAIAGEPAFVADDRELQRAGDSYTVDTLVSLRQDFPSQPLCLLLGMDAFNGFADWRQPEEILRLAHLIVMHRPGLAEPSDDRAREILAAHRCDQVSALREQNAGLIHLQGVTQLEISSTQIRSLVAADRNPRYLLPEPVLELVQENGLYRMMESVLTDPS